MQGSSLENGLLVTTEDLTTFRLSLALRRESIENRVEGHLGEVCKDWKFGIKVLASDEGDCIYVHTTLIIRTVLEARTESESNRAL